MTQKFLVRQKLGQRTSRFSSRSHLFHKMSFIPELIEEAEEVIEFKRKYDELSEFTQRKRFKHTNMNNSSVNRSRAGKRKTGPYGYKTRSKNVNKRINALERKVTAISPVVKTWVSQIPYTDYVGWGQDFKDHNVVDLIEPLTEYAKNEHIIRLHSLHIRISLHDHIVRRTADNKFGKLRLLVWSHKGKPGTNAEGLHPLSQDGPSTGVKHCRFINQDYYNIWADVPMDSLDSAFLEANCVFKYPLKVILGGTVDNKGFTNDLIFTLVDEDKVAEKFNIQFKVRWSQE